MFPSMDAFGGWGGLMGLRPKAPPPPRKLSELNRNCQRFPDTYTNDYASLLRDPNTGKDLGPLSPQAQILPVVTVGLVGAGIGNLVAAYELARCGIVPVIFEASDRVGGRMHTHDLDDGASGELGAMRVPDGSKLFWHYFQKYWTALGEDDISIEPFPNPGVVPTHVNWQNSVTQFWNKPPYDTCSNLPAIATRTQKEFVQRVKQYKVGGPNGEITWGMVHDILRKETLSGPDELYVKLYWQSCIDTFEQRSLGSVIADEWQIDGGQKVKWGPNEISAFATLGLGTGGFGPLYSVSYLEMLRLMLWDYAGEYPIPAASSMSLFANWFPKAIFEQVDALYPGEYTPGDLLKLNTEVLGVSVAKGSHSRLQSVLMAADGRHDYDFCIVGMTHRAMQKLGLDGNSESGSLQSSWLPFSLGQPTDDDGQRKVIASVQAGMRWTHMMSASKTFQKVPTQDLSTWPKYEYPEEPEHAIEVTLTDKYPRASYWLKNSASQFSAVLTSYTWGNDSVKLEAVHAPWLPRQQMLASAFPLMSSETSSYDAYSVVEGALDRSSGPNSEVTIDWQSRKGFYGGFKLDQPGDYYYTSSLAFHYRIADDVNSTIPAQLVYLTGDSISFFGGWIEGAMMSGINAATAILRRCQFPSLRSAPLMSASAMPFHKYQQIGARTSMPAQEQLAEPVLAK